MWYNYFFQKSFFCSAEKPAHHIYWKREDNGRIFLWCDISQCLKISELQSGRRLAENVGCLFQCERWFHFTFSSNYFGTSISRCFSLRCHCTLQLRRQTDVFSVISRKTNRFKNIQMNSKHTHISTRSTWTPHGPVAISNDDCIVWLIASRSVNNSDKFRVPKTFRSVVAAKSLVEWL